MKIKDVLKILSQYNENYDIMVAGNLDLKAFHLGDISMGYYTTINQGKTGQLVDPSDPFVRGEDIHPTLILEIKKEELEVI